MFNNCNIDLESKYGVDGQYIYFHIEDCGDVVYQDIIVSDQGFKLFCNDKDTFTYLTNKCSDFLTGKMLLTSNFKKLTY